MNQTRPNTPALIICLCLCAVELAACQRARVPSFTPPPGGGWPFAPAKLVVHPLTHLVTGGESPHIDAHIELLDAAGDEVKGVGALTLELTRGIGGAGGRARLWQIDLNDLGRNSEAYDRVTRTYRFELTGMPAEALDGRGATLRVTLTTPDGRKLSGDRRLEAN